MEEGDGSAFLDSQCASDPSLRVELNELLAAEGKLGSSFLESPALAHAAVRTDTSATDTVLPAGTKLGPYVVQALIGAGGMGEVDRARDARLERTVAIKIIPATHSSDGAVRTAFGSPWQNGMAERWVGSVRCDLLDHVIVLNQRHLSRLLKNYLHYCHEDQTHLGPGKDTPGARVTALAPSERRQGRLHATTRWIAPPLQGDAL